MELELEIDAIAGVLVVTARGRMVRGALEQLQGCLGQAAQAHRPVVLKDAGLGHTLALQPAPFPSTRGH